jgi:hypothetical protein
LHSPHTYSFDLILNFFGIFISKPLFQIHYILQLVRPIIEQKASSFEVTPEATDAYNTKIQARISGSVFPHCFSWYRSGYNGKVASVFPGPALLFWWWLLRPNWNDYTAVGVSSDFTRRQRLHFVMSICRRLVSLAVVGGICVWWWSWWSWRCAF